MREREGGSKRERERESKRDRERNCAFVLWRILHLKIQMQNMTNKIEMMYLLFGAFCIWITHVQQFDFVSVFNPHGTRVI